jgi:hypothetical protein
MDQTYDAESLDRRLDVRRRARRAAKGDPAPLGAVQADIALFEREERARLARDRRVAADAAELEMRRIALPRLEVSTVESDVRAALARIEGRVGPALRAAQRKAARARADLEAFRRRSDLRRPAAYPPSPLLAIAMLAAAAIVESAFSSAIFAEGSDAGLLGGATLALGLSGANVALGFLAGYLGLRYAGARAPGRKALGVVCFALALIVATGLNLFAASTRQNVRDQAAAEARLVAEPKIAQSFEACRAKAERADDPVARRRLTAACTHMADERRAAAAPAPGASFLDLSAPEAVILLMLGGAAWVFAALKGYSGVDDPYPDYGKLARIADRLDEDWEERRAEARAALEATTLGAQDALAAGLDALAAAAAARRAAFDAAAVRIATLDARLRLLFEASRQLRDWARAAAGQDTVDAAHEPSAPPPLDDALAGLGALIAADEEALAAARRAAAQTIAAATAALEAASLRVDTSPEGETA